jgi:hypothetical protein
VCTRVKLRVVLAASIGLGAWAATSGVAMADPPTTFCQTLPFEQVAGGNNELEGHPGNHDSPLWEKGQGARMTFQIPANPTVRHDCLGAAAGVGLKMFFTGSDGTPTSDRILVELQWVNRWIGGGFHYEDMVWGVIVGSPGPHHGTDDDEVTYLTSKQTISLCHLDVPGGTVSLEITPSGSNAFIAKCLVPGGGNWESMMGNTAYVPAESTGTGVQIAERYRIGDSGGLNFSPTNLKWMNLAGNWVGWDNANCWVNTSSDYFFDNGTTSFDVYAGTPQPAC